MDGHNIQYISTQLNAIAKSVYKIAKGVNNPWNFIINFAGVAVPLLLGFIAIFQDKIRYCLFKPKLNVSVKEPAGIITDKDYYGGNPHYKFVFEIKNTGKSTLEDAETLVTDIWELNKNANKLNPMPFNLTWQQKGDITIPKIPSNTYKFFNFGDILKPDSEQHVSQYRNYSPPSSIEFKFVDKKIDLKTGNKYKIRIEFSGNNIKPQIKFYKLEIKNKWVEDVKNIKEMLTIE